MPEALGKDESKGFSMKDVEDRVERDFENFKKAVNQYFSEK